MMEYSRKPDVGSPQLLDTFQGSIREVGKLPYAIFFLCSIRNIMCTGISKKTYEYLIDNYFHYQLLVFSG